MLRQIALSTVVLIAVSNAILDFKLTIDKRLVNEQGKINPVPFAKGVYKAVKPYVNASDDEQTTVMMNFVRSQYGEQQAARVQQLLKSLTEISKQLPESLQASVNEGLEKLNQETVQIDYNFEKIQSQIPPGDILQRIQKEILPLASDIFYNPFDQEANAKLSSSEVTVIEHKFF